MALLARPEKLVFFVAVKQVVLFGSLLESAFYAESHRHETHAVLGIGRIKTGLIKIEGSAVSEAIEGRRRFFSQPQGKQPQPAALQRCPGEFPVEGDQVFRVESIGAAAGAPAPVMESNQHFQGLLALSLRFGALEAHLEAFS